MPSLTSYTGSPANAAQLGLVVCSLLRGPPTRTGHANCSWEFKSLYSMAARMEFWSPLSLRSPAGYDDDDDDDHDEDDDEYGVDDAG